MPELRRVVVTGVGLVTSLGNDVATVWDNALAGKSGVRRNPCMPEESKVHISSAPQDFKVEDFGLPDSTLKLMRRMDTFIAYGTVAAKLALEDAGLPIPVEEGHSSRFGVAIGSGIGGIKTIEDQHQARIAGGMRKVSPYFVPGSIVNMAAGIVSIMANLKGPCYAITNACSTGSYNIGAATRNIQLGEADVMLAGGCESTNDSEMSVAGFASAKTLSTRNDDPERASRPWDRDRDGFVIGSGAGVLVLEEYQRAKSRNSRIYGEIVGIGMSSDAHHIAAPETSGTGMATAMRNALQDAGGGAFDGLGYINAHATSTPMGDKIESVAVEKVFADRAKSIPISSTKSMHGHLLGAAGSVEAILTLLALQSQKVPPTINLDNPEEGCVLDYVPNSARDHKFDYAMSNSAGFGGANFSLVMQRLP